MSISLAYLEQSIPDTSNKVKTYQLLIRNNFENQTMDVIKSCLDDSLMMAITMGS